MASEPLIVVGAGLAGSMMALMMARKGFRVELYELRGDYRVAEQKEEETLRHLGQSRDPTKRSINLALSARGLAALEAVELAKPVLAGVIPMPCRAIHAVDGAVTTQPYGRPGEAIHSASRSLLNTTLLDACDACPNVSVFFNHKLVKLATDGTATFLDTSAGSGPGVTRTVKGRLVIGADGAYSATRDAMMRISRMDYARTYIEHGYKELNMPPVPVASAGAGTGGELTWAMPVTNALHIWPRHRFMLIALPNPDKTFTCTLFLPWPVLDALDADAAKVRPFFEEHFPDALPLIPELEKQFTSHPSSALVMNKCAPWNIGSKALLIGDAAHSIVPFYGQGANAAFEDCLVFREVLEGEAGGDLDKAVQAFAAKRKPAGDAIAQLSLDNYVEMRHHTASRLFLFRKKVEGWLQWLLPEGAWTPLYSMVSFTRIPYDEVIRRAQRQDAIINGAVAVLAAAALAGGVAYAVKSGGAAAARDRVTDAWRAAAKAAGKFA